MASKPSSVGVASVASEFRTVRLPDRRLDRRLKLVADWLSAAPEKGFPRMAESDGALEALYRFFNNARVSPRAVMEGHFEQTGERARATGTVVVAHDTTEMQFSGESPREGLGVLRPKAKGFLLHLALCIAADGGRRPLGVLGAKPFVRTAVRPKRRGRRLSGPEYAQVRDKESQRWAELVQQCERRIGEEVSMIHVMDREADAFPLLSMLVEQQSRFVVRLARDRTLCGQDEEPHRLAEALAAAEDLFELDVPLSRRRAAAAPRTRRTFVPRLSRTARLRVRVAQVKLQRPRYLHEQPESLALSVVHVHEVDAPQGETPVSWVLATTEPTTTHAQTLKVLEHYRCRWQIEEYFKALKTGCAFESRQLESYDALLRALAVFLPIAWQLLLLRNLPRTNPEAPATAVLSPVQIEVLRACSSYKLPAEPTVRDALFSVARLGGHIRNNGYPGWRVLGWGMEELLTLELGWTAALKAERRSDQ